MSAVPGSEKVTRWQVKPAACERLFKHAQRTGIGRGYRGAADEIAGNGESISHALRLTCMPPGGLALGGTISSSLCWSQPFCGGGVDAALSSTSASGSGPNRLLPRLPCRQNISTKPHSHEMLHDQHDRKDPVGVGQQVRELAEQAGHDEERNDPPAAPVAIMQPLDRSREVNPQEQRRAERLENQGRAVGGRQQTIGPGIDHLEEVVESRSRKRR